MAETIVNNVYQAGAESYTLGTANLNNTSAQRSGIIFGPADTLLNTADAVNEWYAINGLYYPLPGGLGNLPCQTVRGVRLDKNIIQLFANYSFAGGGYPIQSSSTLTAFGAGYFNFRSWHKAEDETDFDDQRRPKGDLNFVDYSTTPTKIGRNQSYPPAVINYDMFQCTIRVPTVLPYNPYSLIVDREGCINTGLQTFAGYSFPPYSVKFVNAQIDPIQNGTDDPRWRVLYTFIYRPCLWVNELPPVWDVDNTKWIEARGYAIPSGNAWYTLNTKPVSFGSGFPVYS